MLIEKKTWIDVHRPKTGHSSSRTPSVTPSLPTSPMPSQTDSQDSAESSQTGSTNTFFSTVSHISKQAQVTQPKGGVPGKSKEANDGVSSRGGERRIIHRSSKSDASLVMPCFPGEEEESQGTNVLSEDIGFTSTIKNFLSSVFAAPTSGEQSTNDHQHLKPQKSYRSITQEDGGLISKTRVSPSKSYTYGVKQAKHSKTASWPSMEHDWLKESDVKEIATPILLMPLRVQHVDLDKLKATWDIHHYNDIFVHPLTLPELYKLHKGKESYLVTLSLPVKPQNVPKGDNGGDLKLSQVASVVSSNIPTPGGKQIASTPLPEKPSTDEHRGLSRLLSKLAEYAETGSSTPPTSVSSPVPSQTSQEPCLTKTVVCRLQFATAIKFLSKRKRSSTAALEEVSVSREGSTSPTHGSSPTTKQSRPLCFIPVLPQHVVISELIQQQLGVKTGSQVILRHCQASWRVECHRNRVSLYLQPIVKVCVLHTYIQWSSIIRHCTAYVLIMCLV